MRNEASTIDKCLRSLLSQTIPPSAYEIIVVNGMSDDGSAEIVAELQAISPNLILLANPVRTMPAGMNIGLRKARAPIVMVAGAHASYPSHYLQTCLHYLENTGADVVGGPLITTACKNAFAPRMIAAILSSPFGVGNADFRTGLKEGWVDTVPYGAYRKDIFHRCGMYNEKLVRAQDCELHARIRGSGGRIYQTPELLTHYHPVSTFPALWRKAFLDGEWQWFAVIQNPQSFAPRRFAPLLMLLVLSAAAVLAAFVSGAWVLIAMVLLAYLLAGLYFSFTQTVIQSGGANFLTKVLLPFCTFPFHFFYGLGITAGLWHSMQELVRMKRTTSPLKSQGKDTETAL